MKKVFRPKGAPKNWIYHFWCPCEWCIESEDHYPEPTIEELIEYKNMRKKMPIYKLLEFA